MKKAIKARLAKDIDKMSIKNGMPSLVLMERAAYEVARESLSVLKEKATTNATKLCDMKALVVCGVGNNGADGLACARMLNEEGVKVEVLIVGDEGKATKEYEVQKNLIDVLLIPYFYKKDIRTFADKEYNIIIDAIFGIGLTRDVSGEFGEVIDAINSCKNYVISVDIPSGIDSDCGKIRAHAIRADKTVTFGYKKLGHMLYPGREYSGEVVVKNIGFMPLPELFDNKDEFVSYIDDFSLPVRERRTNKGSFGKPLIIAGSKDMTGAAFMSGMAAYKSGSGVVSVLTHESCDEYVKSILPEAIVKKYSDDDTYNEVKGFLKGASLSLIHI